MLYLVTDLFFCASTTTLTVDNLKIKFFPTIQTHHFPSRSDANISKQVTKKSNQILKAVCDRQTQRNKEALFK